MIKKLIFLVAFMALLNAPSLAENKEHTKFAHLHGGIVATGEQIQSSEVHGTFRGDGLIKTYKNLYLIGGFQDLLAGEEVKGENYDLGFCYFTRNPNSLKPQIYLLLGNGYTHINGSGDFGNYTYSGGFGFLLPWKILDVALMGQIRLMQVSEKERLVHISFGVHSGIDL